MWTVRSPAGKVGTCADQCQLKMGGWFGLRMKIEERVAVKLRFEIHSHSRVANLVLSMQMVANQRNKSKKKSHHIFAHFCQAQSSTLR